MGSVGTTLAHLVKAALLRAGVVLAGFIAAGTVAGVAWGVQDVAFSMGEPPGGDLTIEGSISDVTAGSPSAPLRLTLRNPAAEPRAVTRVRAVSTGVEDGPAVCGTAGLLTIDDWTGAVTVPAHGTTTVTLPVAVSVDLPAECVAVTWGLAYTAY